jgi:ATP-dependent helicase Lhr and Lhr-like helicase
VLTSTPVPFGFSPLVARWFETRFGSPTPAQAAGWPAIASGTDTLIAAPTGSGKTLAAFLWSIDRLVRQASDGTLTDGTQVLYISPLKALGNDIQKNLAVPLAELGAQAAAALQAFPEVRVAVRSGDTPARDRQAMLRHPPHILITTPESLYILLTAQKSRAFLAGVSTVIVDEIHAIAQDKRGSHLALTLERLDLLVGRPVQRIGLSATQKPIERVGTLLVGAARPAPTIIDTGHRRAVDLSIEIPDDQLGPVATHEQWAAILDRVTALVQAHRETIVFVNTRRLVERVAHALEERIGADKVVAHHGSMSRRTRLEAEERLKSGAVPVVVATASLELGIDVGAVDLVCHLGSARALATLIQRVGRSGHARGALPKGIIFPLTRDDLVQAAAAVRGILAGALDTLRIPHNARDILAQQCVATVASTGEMSVESLYAMVRRSYAYADLSRTHFDEIVDLLAEGVTTRRGRRSAHLHFDRVHGVLRPRRGARLAAITGGGAIPDTGQYDVVEEPAELLVGKVDEDFAVESMRGDIFLLGNRSWRVRRVEAGRMRVDDAQGAPPTVPFWVGEAPGRTLALSTAVSELRAAVAAQLPDVAGAATWVEAECHTSPDAAKQLVAYIAETHAALGVVPTQDRVVAERFFDEAGGQQLVLHTPFGGAVNRAWGLALRKRFCVTFNFELQAAATDDGLVLSLGQQHSFPLDSVFSFIRRNELEEDLSQAALAAPMFTNRWRWNATRALALLRFDSGRKVPFPLQRMRAEDLLAAVFPEQLGCQDNMGPGPIPIPDHPLVQETIDNCLREAMDVDTLRNILERIDRGEIATHAVDTVAPSPMSHEILNSNPYAYLDDAPLEERRARAVSLRQTTPALAGGLAALDPAAILEVQNQAWPAVRDLDELHDQLLSFGVLPRATLERAGWSELAARLVHDHRATWTADRLVAAERTALVQLALPGTTFDPPMQAALFDRRPQATTEEEALRAIVGGWLEVTGPVSVPELAERMGIDPGRVAIGLAQLERVGTAMRGRYRPGGTDEEWCDRALLARIHRLTLGRLRREIEPVSIADFLRFLCRWQHVHPGAQQHGRHAVIEVIGQLQGLEIPARAWEAHVLPARIARYDPDDLEQLCLAGAVAWGRLRVEAPDEDPTEGRRARTPNRAAPLAFVLRDDLPWLLGPTADPGELPRDADAVFAFLSQRGASFIGDIARGTGLLPAAVEEALWTLVARGLVTGDGIAGLRRLIEKPDDTRRRDRRLHAVGHRARLLPAGRWSLLRSQLEEAPTLDPARCAQQLLRRWGVVMRDLLAREANMPPWRTLLGALRTMEARGEIRGGRFVAGLVGEQFALPGAVEALRAVRRGAEGSETVIVSAADPLNLVGTLLPGARVAPASLEVIAYRNGVVAEIGELGAVRSRLGRDVLGA